MNNNFCKTIGLTIIIGGFLISTYLIIAQIINESVYIVILLGCIIVGFLIYKIEDIVEFKTRWIKLRTLQKEVYAKAEEVEKVAKELKNIEKDLRKSTKAFIENFYLTICTKGKFPPPGKVVKKLEQNLSVLADFAIEDPEERKRWKNEMDQLLG